MPWNNHMNMQNILDFGDGPGEEHANNVNPLLNMRERLFLSLFERIASAYSSAIPRESRKSIEYAFLSFAVVPMFILIYLHVNFIQIPVNCLASVSNRWPRDGVLRVELEFPEETTISEMSLWACQQSSKLSNSKNKADQYSEFQNIENSLSNETGIACNSKENSNSSRVNQETSSYTDYSSIGPQLSLPELPSNSKLENYSADKGFTSESVWPPKRYIIEYTLEYGFLKLSEDSRQKLKVPVLVVALDPHDEKCFGNSFSQFLLKYIVGYSDVLMSSLKHLVDKDETKGFVRNVISGDQYRFVNKTLTWTSYVIAGLTMIAFTLSISMLLRYSHYQIFLFIVQVLHVLEFNFNASFSAASILTVVFALVGMEAIMSEFFNDSTTALYIILIVWFADQFDTVCCRNVVTKRHWLRFFYLYHFAFYAYDYRFNGQYSSLALFISWMFIQHSMIYFFHRFELTSIEPNIEAELNEEIQTISNPDSLSSFGSRQTSLNNHESLSAIQISHDANSLEGEDAIRDRSLAEQNPNDAISSNGCAQKPLEIRKSVSENQPQSFCTNVQNSVASTSEFNTTGQLSAHSSHIT